MEFAFTQTNVLIAGLTFAAVVCVGGAFIAAGAAQREALQARLRLRTDGMPDDSARRRRQSFLGRVFSAIGHAVSPKGISNDLQRKMAQAGWYSPAASAAYIGTKIFLLIVASLSLGMASTLLPLPLPIKLIGVISLAGLVFFIPNIILSLRIGQRTLNIRRHLPDSVDLLEICVSGGMGIDQAWVAVEDQVRPVCSDLADEVALTNLEMHLGADRGAAMRHMADRTGAEELNSLVATLVQSERFGTSLTDALRVFTAGMRELRSQRAEESAEKMAVKMIFPMVTLIFPVILIIAVGPAGITLAEIFGGN
jgi:tight adherence protein C